MWFCVCVYACVCVLVPRAAEEEEEEEGGAFLFDETGSVLELLSAALAVVQQVSVNTVELSMH